MKTVLITGAHGFLGRNCAREFAGRGFRVIGLGYGIWDDEAPADFGIGRWIESGVTLDALTAVNEPIDVIVHCAGSGSVGYSLAQPMKDFQMTVDTTLAVLEFMRLEAPGATLVYPSSAAVYGCRDAVPLREDDQLQPVSPYGFHKRIAEELCASYAGNYGLKVSIVRFFSIYGSGLQKQLLWEACRKLKGLQEGDAVEFFGTGDETRDWLHVRDAAALVRVLAERGGSDLVVNGGTGAAVRVGAILGRLAVEMGCKGQVGFNGVVRVGDPQHQCADITLGRELGWSPAVTLEEGLQEYVAWFRGGVAVRNGEVA